MYICESKKPPFLFPIFTLFNAKQIKYYWIGHVTSATSKGSQVKITEPMVSIKVTNCSIHLG